MKIKKTLLLILTTLISVPCSALTVLAQSMDSASPGNGDIGTPELFAIIGGIALIVIVVMLILSKKRKK